jgi:phage terminase large subunit-like protein
MVAGMDGTLAFGWAKDAALDAEIRDVITAAAEQWQVVEVSHPKRIRGALFAELAEQGIACRPWDSTADNEAHSANEFYRAILEGRIVHDHDAMVSGQMGRLRVRWGVDGSLRLARPDDGAFVDAAFAARAAWWRAGQLAEALPADTPTVY